MGYEYEDLDDSQFERLVVQVMRKLFGPAVQGFATGPDGGRDALFSGTAERFPSAAAPWTGRTVGQAKHTNAVNAHFSDPGFGGTADKSTLTEEVARLVKLVKAGQIDNYILFSNRRLGAVTSAEVVKRVSEETGINEGQIYLAGVEYLDDMLREFPELVRLARIDPVDGPLVVSSHQCAEVILAVSQALAVQTPVAPALPVDRVSYNEKNVVNGMTAEFAKVLTKRYLMLTRQIEQFLAAAANAQVRDLYEAAVEDFQLKVVAHRSDHQTFDNVFNYLVDLLVKRDPVLARNARLTRALVFYMYWHCDIGETPDVAAE